MNLNRNLFFLIVFAFSIPESFGQVGQKGLEWIDRALEEKNYLQADSALKAQLNSIQQNGLVDSLPLYTSYIGRVETEKSGQKNGIAKVQKFISDFIFFTIFFVFSYFFFFHFNAIFAYYARSSYTSSDAR